MHPLTKTFEDGRRRLAANPSVAVLANPAIPVADKFAVVPTMAFWILAFADAMAFLRATCGDSPLDRVLLRHAEEDAEHWRWFLVDLGALSAEGLGAPSIDVALLRQWEAEVEPVRACGWTLHHLLRTHRDPVTRLCILEACEDGFEAFMDSMRPVVVASGRHADLQFLGAVHDEAEAGHSLHEMDDPLEQVDWREEDVAAIREVVDTMYQRLDAMHTSYAVAIRSVAS